MVNVILVVETFLAFVVAIVIHESGHAGMASLLGDGTPASEGRLSVSPARHLAPMGTLVAAVLSFAPIYAGIGWGRPVRIDQLRMRVGPNAGIALVALAGPLINLFIGVALAAGVALIPNYHLLSVWLTPATGRCPLTYSPQQLQECLSAIQSPYVLRVEQFLLILALTNIVIAFINVLPLHPLDGYRVVFALLPNDQAVTWRRWEPYMEAITLILFFVVPVLLRFIGLEFEPASLFRSLAQVVVNKIAGAGTVITVLL